MRVFSLASNYNYFAQLWIINLPNTIYTYVFKTIHGWKFQVNYSAGMALTLIEEGVLNIKLVVLT